MVYKDIVLGTLTQTAIDERDNVYFKMAQEVEEVYRKAKAFDAIVNIQDDFVEYHGFYPCVEEYAEEVEEIISEYTEDKQND